MRAADCGSDGHDFAGQAVERGAAALVVERELEPDVPQLVVASSRLAMAAAADAFYGHPSRQLQVVGVTGTNGKTTTAFLLHAVLDAAGLRPGLLGTVEQRVGGVVEPVIRTTPESVDLQATLRRMLDAGDCSCAMEVSSHALELERVAGVRFAAAAFTNLTQDHLDFHGDMESYYRAKARLFADAPGAVNVGDEWGQRLADEAGGRVLTYTRGTQQADVAPQAVEIGAGGVISLIARTPRGLLPLDVRLRGALQRRERAGRGGGGRTAGAAARGGAGRRGRGGRRARPVRGGGRRPAVHRAGGLRAHAGRARERARTRPARSPAGG